MVYYNTIQYTVCVERRNYKLLVCSIVPAKRAKRILGPKEANEKGIKVKRELID